MNLLLLEPHQLNNSDGAHLTQRQQTHLQNVLRVSEGTCLKVGLLDGSTGTGVIIKSADQLAISQLELHTPSPAQLPLTLILALPRPQMIKRILQTVACMGVHKLILLQTAKVEKSFWQSPAASDSAIREQLILGLEQAGATQLPVVEKYPRFRPFVEDSLAKIVAGKSAHIAHPGNYSACPQLALNQQAVVAIGPEGGFIEQEVEYFEKAGCKPFQLGERILKVETAVPVILARLFIPAL